MSIYRLSDTHYVHGPNRLADSARGVMRLWSIWCILHVPQSQSDSAHLPACLRPLKRDWICFLMKFQNIWGHENCQPRTMSMGQTTWKIFWGVYNAIVVNLMHFACPAATIRLCSPASMSPAAKTRLSTFFNDIFENMTTLKFSDMHHVHGPNRLADILRGFMRLWSM